MKVMKNKGMALILVGLFLVSCGKTYDYSNFKASEISLPDFYSRPEKTYFVYVYGEKCATCESIKQTVLSAVSKGQKKIYLLKYDGSGIPLVGSSDAVREESFGSTESTQKEYESGIEGAKHITIYGTPSLFALSSVFGEATVTGVATGKAETLSFLS